MLALSLFVAFAATAASAQSAEYMEGLGQGYDAEWAHVSRTLVSLAEAIPAEKYAWRPAPGVRSTGEVMMHIVTANFYFISQTGGTFPAELKSLKVEETAKDKAKVMAWLKRSLDEAGKAHAAASAEDLKKNVKFLDKPATYEGVYLRMIVHANEHMGQLIAYARMNGVTPPWSEKK